MALGDRVPDKTLLKEMNKRLMRAGAQANVTASVSGGYITLTGTIQYENQRRMIIKKANLVNGVRRVIDQMTVKPRQREI